MANPAIPFPHKDVLFTFHKSKRYDRIEIVPVDFPNSRTISKETSS